MNLFATLAKWENVLAWGHAMRDMHLRWKVSTYEDNEDQRTSQRQPLTTSLTHTRGRNLWGSSNRDN